MSQTNKQQLAEQIIFQKIEDWQIFYSLTNKPGKTFGMENIRLLLFNRTEDELSYLVQNQNLPFKTAVRVPISSKGTIKVSKAKVITNPPKTNKFNIKTSEPDLKNKGKFIEYEWEFIMKSEKLAQEWAKLLLDHQDHVKNKQIKIAQKKEIAGRQKEADKDQEAQDAINFLVTNSKLISNQPKSEIKKESQMRKIQENKQDLKKEEPKKEEPKRQETKKQEPKKEEDNRYEKKNGKNEDWNYKFYKNPTQEIIKDFSEVAVQAFASIYKKSKDKEKSSTNFYELDNLTVEIAPNCSMESKRLKNQFRNYHYILQCTPTVIRVPLTCLIQHHGIVGFVKAVIPPEAQQIHKKGDCQSILRQLQKLSKIKSSTLMSSNCRFFDLTKLYDNSDSIILYVDELQSYLPELFKQKGKEEQFFLARPQLIQNRSSLLMGGNRSDQKMGIKDRDLESQLKQEIIQAGRSLSNEEIYLSNICDLKQFLHDRGVNTKMLDKLKKTIANPLAKKYVHTSSVAKVSKDIINISLAENSNSKQTPQRFVEKQIRSLVEGKTVFSSSLWKEVAQQYLKIHGEAISSYDIEGGYFLSCLLSLIPADYDLNCLDKQKQIFVDEEIIKEGFVKSLFPKVKSYNRFDNQCVQLSKHSLESEKAYEYIVEKLELRKRQLSPAFQFQSRRYILAYLSDFVQLEEREGSPLKCVNEIYSLVNYEPPSAATLKITVNYLGSCLNKKNNKDFEGCIKKAIEIVGYWLGQNHPQICELYDKLAFFVSGKGDTAKGIELLEKSLAISYSAGGKNFKKLGLRHYVLGEQYAKIGKKKIAYENLQKARQYLSKVEDKQNQYALVLLSLSSIELSNGNIRSSISLGNQGIKLGEKVDIRERYLIKGFEIICRGLQVEEDWDQLKKLSLTCARRFNATENQSVFVEMLKISLTGLFGKMPVQRSGRLIEIARRQGKEKKITEEESLKQLMKQANKYVVMQKFSNKCDLIDRIWANLSNEKSLGQEQVQFISLLRALVGCVGLQFMEGLYYQKQQS